MANSMEDSFREQLLKKIESDNKSLLWTKTGYFSLLEELNEACSGDVEKLIRKGLDHKVRFTVLTCGLWRVVHTDGPGDSRHRICSRFTAKTYST